MQKIEDFLSQTKAREIRAHNEVSSICEGKRKWKMCIPAQLDDSDVVISQSLSDIQKYEALVRELIAEVNTLHADLKRIATADDVEAAGVFVAMLMDEKRGLDAVEERWTK